MLKIAICDDDQRELDKIEKLLHDQDKTKYQIEKFTSGELLLDAYEKGNSYSIICLDMILGGINGIEVAKQIRKYDSKVIIIIITSIIEYALEGYDVGAYNFILKPIDENKFIKIIEAGIKTINSSKKTYSIIKRDLTKKISLDEIIYIESSKKRSDIYFLNGKESSNENITNIEQKLKNEKFFRISRYYIINIKHILEIHPKVVIMSNGKELSYNIEKAELLKDKYLDFAMEE